MTINHVCHTMSLFGNVRRQQAWDMIADYTLYPSIIPSVHNVNIIERDVKSGISTWILSIDDAPLAWTQKDVLQEKLYRIEFELITGDFDLLQGQWTIELHKHKGVVLQLSIDYNLGIPVIEEVMGHILKEKMQQTIELFVKSIGEQLLAKQIEQRASERHYIGKYTTVKIDDHAMGMHVINVSRDGMMFHSQKPITLNEFCISLQTMSCRCELLEMDTSNNIGRVMFKKSLQAMEVQTILDSMMYKSVHIYFNTLVTETDPKVFSVR